MRTLGAPFVVAQPPQPLPGAHWVVVNEDLARGLGLRDWIGTAAALDLSAGNTEPVGGTLASAYSGHQFGAWAVRYRQRLQAEASHDGERAQRMNRTNPKYVLRNHLAETAIEHARNGDFAEVERLLKVLQHPFDEQPLNEADAAFPPDWAAQLEVSCSS